MNARELIAKLSDLPGDTPIKISVWDDLSDNPDTDQDVTGVDEYGYLDYVGTGPYHSLDQEELERAIELRELD